MIFHDLKCVFFHIPKTAGTSIEKLLDGGKKRDPRIFYEDVLFGFHKNKYTHHLNYKGMLDYVSEETLENYLKFCVVRNPWDRLVSAFHYNFKGECNNENFKKFLMIKSKDVLSGKAHNTDHFNTQLNWILSEDDEIIPNYICRYENLNCDISGICESLGIENNLKHINISKNKRDYRTYYDDELLTFVNDMYSKEINYLKYEF